MWEKIADNLLFLGRTREWNATASEYLALGAGDDGVCGGGGGGDGAAGRLAARAGGRGAAGSGSGWGKPAHRARGLAVFPARGGDAGLRSEWEFDQ